MKLSEQTLHTLKNFASINPNVVVDGGTIVKTMAEAKNIMAIATIPDKFESPFYVYDLNEFLAVYDMMNSITPPEVQIDDQAIILKSGNSRVTYRQADKSILTYPQKDINMPNPEVKVSLTDTLLKQIKKSASVLGHATLSINGNGESVNLEVFDPADRGANRFSINEVVKSKHKFDFHFLINSLKLVPGDYDVSISSRLISQWKHTNNDLNYFIALEKTSTFTE